MMKKIRSRFYIQESLQGGDNIILSKEISHHAYGVLRIKEQEFITLFNEQDGEFICEVISSKKNSVEVKLLEKIKSHTQNKCHIHLIYAPLKKDANDFVLEKSTELGVNEITQIITHNTVNKPLDIEKIISKTTQATQQCGRLDLPKINAAITLENFLSSPPQNTKVFWLNEKKLGDTLSNYLQKNSLIDSAILLIGPEGGFSKDEFQLLSHKNEVIPVFFNGNILRAETACITGIAHLQIFSCNF